MYSYYRDIYFSVKYWEGDEYNSNFRVWFNFHENKFQKILICQNSIILMDTIIQILKYLNQITIDNEPIIDGIKLKEKLCGLKRLNIYEHVESAKPTNQIK